MQLNRLLLGMALFAAPFARGQSTNSNVNYVDPTIGSVGIILEPTRPVVHLPNSMVRVFPIRKDQLDDRIYNFPSRLRRTGRKAFLA